MSRYTLPRHIDARKASKQEAKVSGTIRVDQLLRLGSSLHNSTGEIFVDMRFSKDELDRSVVEIETSCNLDLTCQRCLGIVKANMATQARLAIIFPEAKGDYLPLPDGMEALLTNDPCDTWEAVEDELILALPAYPNHPDGKCDLPSSNYSNIDFAELEQKDMIKPFSDLPRLLRNNVKEGESYGSSKE